MKLVGGRKDELGERRRMDQGTVRGATISGSWRLPVEVDCFSHLIGQRTGMKQNSVRLRLMSAPWLVETFQAMHS